MNQSQKDFIKKVFALILKLLVLLSICILVWNIFFYIPLFLFISSILYLIIIGVIGLSLEIHDVYTDNDKAISKILNKWIESEKKELLNSKLICPSCGHKLSMDSKICSNCGHALKHD